MLYISGSSCAAATEQEDAEVFFADVAAMTVTSQGTFEPRMALQHAVRLGHIRLTLRRLSRCAAALSPTSGRCARLLPPSPWHDPAGLSAPRVHLPGGCPPSLLSRSLCPARASRLLLASRLLRMMLGAAASTAATNASPRATATATASHERVLDGRHVRNARDLLRVLLLVPPLPLLHYLP